MIIDDAGGLVFRPPSEARSFILRVTIGCSHNQCTFCSMYKESAYRIRSLEEIDGIIERGALAMPFIRRIFLADGDALVLPTENLLHILKKCHDSFPNITRIGAYATPNDLNRKSLEELRALKEAGLDILYMGIESGDDTVLRHVHKGTTAERTISAGQKALQAGMKLSTMILLGLGGQERSREHALHTAAVISAIQPTMLSALSLIIPYGSPLYKETMAGTFTPLTARGFLEELELIIHNIDVQNVCIFRSNHVSNLFPVKGTLPKDKENMLLDLASFIPQADDVHPLLNDNGNF